MANPAPELFRLTTEQVISMSLLAGALMKKLHCLWPVLELEMVGRTVPLAAIENRSKQANVKIVVQMKVY
jgi:hypothetical protein